MAGSFETNSYKELYEMTIDAVDWLRSLNVRVENSRLEHYVSDLGQLVAHLDSGLLAKMSGVELQSFDRNMRESLFEAADLIGIHRHLKSCVDPGLLERLRGLTKGPKSYPLEKNDSNQPRNLAFELLVAARFAASDFAPIFSSNADLMIWVGNVPVVVECKRPQSYGAISQSVRKANKQIEKRAAELREDVLGIVAIDITKTLNPSHRQVVFSGQAQFDETLGDVCSKYFQMLSGEWGLQKYSRTIAVLIRVCGLGIQNDAERYTYFQEFVLHTFKDGSARQDQVLSSIETAFAMTRQ